MNSKKHTLSRKVLATLLTAAMLITMLPSAMFANGDGSGGQAIQGTVDNPITATSNGVTVNKYVSGNSENRYNLTLEAFASDQLTTTTNTTPLDIVLVLDVSGSMDDNFIDAYTEYIPVYELDQSETYYVNVDGRYRNVDYYDGGFYIQQGWSYWQRRN